MKIIRSLHGFGDNIFQLPIVRAVCEKEDVVYIETPLPFFYSGIQNLKFLPVVSPWRTQRKAQNLIDPSIFSTLPEDAYQQINLPPIRPGYPRPHFSSLQKIVKPELEIKFGYGPDNYSRFNIIQCLERQAKVTLPDQFDFGMPDFGPVNFLDSKGKKIAIVRPPTERAEWFTPSRQCLPEYTNKACEMLKEAGYFTVSVADTFANQEWIVGDSPKADLCCHLGELNTKQLMSLCQHAEVIVGGVGWVVPAGIAFKRNTFIIGGGRGGYDAEGKITDMRMQLDKFTMVQPEPPCLCTEARHNCNKIIPNFEEKFRVFLSSIS